jgi:hypothetical protein
MYQPWLMDDDDEYGAVGGKSGKGKSKVLGETPSQFLFVHHKSYITCPGLKLG